MPRPFGSFPVRWREARNRILQNPRFHRMAMNSAIGRFFARRSAARLFDLTAGFVYSQILAAGLRSGLFEEIAKAPRLPADIAASLGLGEEAANRLLRASAALDLLDHLPDGRFMLGSQGASLLANPGVTAMVLHHDALYADLADPIAAFQTRGRGRLAALWDYSGGDDAPTRETEGYTELMAASQDFVARETLRLFDVSSFRRILDIGGGSGRFLTHVADRNRGGELHLLDRPSVADIAKEALGKRPDAARYFVHGGDFLSSPLPVGCDLICLVRILHDHDDAVVEALLARLCDHLRGRGGTLLISEPMANERSRSRIGDAYFNVYLQAMGSGRARSPHEIGDLLRAAGFASVEIKRAGMPIATSVVVAHASKGQRKLRLTLSCVQIT